MRFLRWLMKCRHRHMYFERRTLDGTPVLHLVCSDCDFARPLMNRTAREHRKAVQDGAVKPLEARR